MGHLHCLVQLQLPRLMPDECAVLCCAVQCCAVPRLLCRSTLCFAVLCWAAWCCDAFCLNSVSCGFFRTWWRQKEQPNLARRAKPRRPRKARRVRRARRERAKARRRRTPQYGCPSPPPSLFLGPPPSPPPPLLLTYMAAAAYACPHWTEVALWSPWNSKAAQLDSMLRLLSYVYYDLFGMTCMAYYACHLFVLSLQGPSVCTL